MHNVEVKIRCSDLDAVRSAAERLGASHAGLLRQRDVFFDAPEGRLKLRRCEGAQPVLIAYRRENAAEARRSTYHLLELTDEQADSLESLLGLVARPCAVVEKERDLYLWRNVRIHLDRVAGLGDFVELEIVGETDDARGREVAARLMRELGLRDEDRVAVAYADMLENV